MRVCINYECDIKPSGHHLRCAICRRYDRMTCTDCGNELMSSRSIRCKRCWMPHREVVVKRSWMNSNRVRTKRRREGMVCLKCTKPLPKGKSLYCSIECRGQKPREFTECQICGINIVGTRKKGYCSDKCYTIHRKKYLRIKRPLQKRECRMCGNILYGKNSGYSCKGICRYTLNIIVQEMYRSNRPKK